MRQNLKSSRRLCHPCWWPWRRLAGRWEGQAPSQDATGRAGELDNAWTWVAARARALGKNRKDKATSTQTSAHGNRPPVYTNSADTHPRARTKPVPRAKLPLNTSERNTNKQTNATTTAPYTGQAAPAPAHAKAQPAPATSAQCLHHALPSHHRLQCAQQPPAHPMPAQTHPTPTARLAHTTALRPEKGTHTLAAKTPPLPAPNNHHQIRPIPPRNDRHLFRKASTHLRPHAARPWPRAGPKKGAGIRPKKRVTKYVHRQLGDTDRDSKLGPPHGPQKKPSGKPGHRHPHARTAQRQTRPPPNPTQQRQGTPQLRSPARAQASTIMTPCMCGPNVDPPQNRLNDNRQPPALRHRVRLRSADPPTSVHVPMERLHTSAYAA